MNKYAAIVSARMGSSRFPGKVLTELYEKKPVLEYLIDRLKLCNNLDIITVATTSENEDQKIVEFCNKKNIWCCDLGIKDEAIISVLSAADLIESFLELKKEDKLVIIDITADCPLIDPYQIDDMIAEFEERDYDYLSNCMVRSFPIGFDVQIYYYNLLKTVLPFTNFRQHSGWNVWAYSSILQKKYKGLLKYGNIISPKEFFFPTLRFVIDYPEDLIFIKETLKLIPDQNPFYRDLINIIKKYPDLCQINKTCRQKTPGEL